MTDPAFSGRPRGSGRGYAVALAAVFLAIIGAVTGFLVGRQTNADKRQALAQETIGGQPTETFPPGTPSASVTPRPSLSGARCPAVSERDAKQTLALVLYVDTTGSEVWICRGADGGLWYQGHRKGGPLDSDRYGLLLPGVQDDHNGVYEVTNQDNKGTTKYIVSNSGLVIVDPSGSTRAPEPAVSYSTG